MLAEFRDAEISGAPSAGRKGSLYVHRVKGPNIEILDAVFAIDVVERSALAEADGKGSVAV